jgi:hypothetical protein
LLAQDCIAFADACVAIYSRSLLHAEAAKDDIGLPLLHLLSTLFFQHRFSIKISTDIALH